MLRSASPNRLSAGTQKKLRLNLFVSTTWTTDTAREKGTDISTRNEKTRAHSGIHVIY